MNKQDFESFQQGMAEAHAFLEKGARDGFVVHEPVNVRRVRERVKLTRKQFAARYHLDSRTVEQWEQGRRKPDKSTDTYLRLIEKAPEEVAQLLADLNT